MQTAFEILVEELGKNISVPLEAEANRTCSLLIDEKITLLMELDKEEENLRILSFFCQLAPGKFRENVLGEALKANHNTAEKGVLGFSDSTNELALYDIVSMDGLDAPTLESHLAKWIDRIFIWKEAIEAGNASPEGDAIPQAPKPFGLR